MEDKPKRDYSYLKKYQFKKGHKPTGHRKKGSLTKKQALTREIFKDILECDPKTGKKLSYEKLVLRLSRIAEGAPRVLLEVLKEVFPPEERVQRVIFQFPEMQVNKQEVSELDDNDTIEGQIVQYELDDK